LDALAAPPEREATARLAAEVTGLIKTFERPYALRRLVDSVRRFYPQLPLIVVDDSRQPAALPGVTTINLPFDSGVSAGKNEGLRHVATTYVLMLDDDFVFYRQTRLEAALPILEANQEIDILGGTVVDLPLHRVTDYRREALFSTTAAAKHALGSLIGGLPVYDKVPNFYLARTERLQRVGWDERLRRVDHADFFARAWGVLTTVYMTKLRCLHAKTRFDAYYMQYRTDVLADQQLLWRRYYAGNTGIGEAKVETDRDRAAIS
jgi:hypothetical protein